jgi:hypothetical protein
MIVHNLKYWVPFFILYFNDDAEDDYYLIWKLLIMKAIRIEIGDEGLPDSFSLLLIKSYFLFTGLNQLFVYSMYIFCEFKSIKYKNVFFFVCVCWFDVVAIVIGNCKYLCLIKL